MSAEQVTSTDTMPGCWKIMQIDRQCMDECADTAVESFRAFLQERYEHVFIDVHLGHGEQQEDEVRGKVMCFGPDDRIEGPFVLSIGDLAPGDKTYLYFSEDLPGNDAFEDEIAVLQQLMKEPDESQLELEFDCL